LHKTKQFQQWLTFWLVHWQNISLLQQMTLDSGNAKELIATYNINLIIT